jgi:hypothetical protein
MRVVTRFYILRRVANELRLFAFGNIVPRKVGSKDKYGGGGAYYATSATTPIVPIDADDSPAAVNAAAAEATAAGSSSSYNKHYGLSAYAASLAMDASGNVGAGYTVSSSDIFPQLRFATLPALYARTDSRSNSNNGKGSQGQEGSNANNGKGSGGLGGDIGSGNNNQHNGGNSGQYNSGNSGQFNGGNNGPFNGGNSGPFGDNKNSGNSGQFGDNKNGKQQQQQQQQQRGSSGPSSSFCERQRALQGPFVPNYSNVNSPNNFNYFRYPHTAQQAHARRLAAAQHSHCLCLCAQR